MLFLQQNEPHVGYWK